MSARTGILRGMLRIWKTLCAPLIGPNCRYYPSCSEYFTESCCRHGMLRGTVLGIKRLCRCNSLFAGGFDPVPDVCQRGRKNLNLLRGEMNRSKRAGV